MEDSKDAEPAVDNRSRQDCAERRRKKAVKMKALWDRIRQAGRPAGEDVKENKDRESKKEKTGKARTAFILAGAAAVLILGLILELLCNLPLLRNREQGNFAIPISEAEYEGFYTQPVLLEGEDGSVREQPALFLQEESGTIRIPIDSYIGALAVSYEYQGLLNLSVRASVKNVYGEVRERDALVFQERNPKTLQTAWLNISKDTEWIELSVSRDGLYEPGLSYLDFSSMPLCFTGFEAVTEPAVNPYRLCFFWLASGTAYFLFVFRRMVGKRIEAAFLFVALTGGALLSLSLPAGKAGFDEEIHFEQSYWIAHYKSPVQLSPTILQEFSAGIDTWPLNQPGGMREQRELNRYLNETGDYRNGTMRWSADLNKTTFTGYLGQAAFLKAGELAGLPFAYLFKFGRLGNLLIYALVMALAIRITPVGKAILSFIGLMPEPLMLAGVYSYDPAVTAFLALSCAMILRAVLEPERKLSALEYGLILVSFIWGCRIKAVYAPLILTGLLIPKERFKSRRQMLLMRAGFFLCFALLMASFALPAILSPSETGDLRGGATSEAGQMAYVLGQPLAYAAVLFSNLFRSFPSYVLGEGAFGTLCHLGTASFPWLFYGGSVAVILTDTGSSCGKHLSAVQKLWIFLLAGASAVLVWTSMYLAFTPPGNTYIEGVQGRYYLPFLFLVWLALSPRAVRVHGKQEMYAPVMIGLSAFILYAVYAADILIPYCL